jgi:2-(1,2-epoxy-1,2-dihydrophenyl)acetyl-CoA isomerase
MTEMTGPEPSVVYSVSAGVATIELNRPNALNALTLEMSQELSAAIDSVSRRDDVRVMLLLGRGRSFCAGGDVHSMAAAEDRGKLLFELASTVHAAILKLAESDIPVVAAVQGAAAGAGLALTLVADVVVAGASSKFLTAYADIGLSPDCGLSWLLPQTIGLRRSLELSLTGRRLTAAQALDWGLITAECPDDDVAETGRRIALKMSNGPAIALGRTRSLLRQNVPCSLAEQLDAEARSISSLGNMPEATDRLAPLLERAGQ